MQLQLVKNSTGAMLLTTHNGEELLWEAKSYTWPDTAQEIAQVVDPINVYWHSLPKERQDDIWGVYKAAKDDFYAAANTTDLVGRLVGTVAQLYALMPYDEFKYFLEMRSGYTVPASVSDVMPATAVTEDAQMRTYLKKDYRELLTLAIALRPMLPIWAEFLVVTRKEIPSTFKEHIAYSLLARTYVVECEAVHRLAIYIQSSLSKLGTSTSAIIGGLGSSELPDWFKSGIVVKRVCLGTMQPQDDRKHVVAEVYKYLNSTISTLDRKFVGNVRDKEPIGSGNDEDNMSVVEMVKVKEDVAIGDIVAINAFAEDFITIGLNLEPGLSENLIKDYATKATKANFEVTDEWHQLMIQLLTAQHISSRGIEALPELAQKALLGTLQAVLVHSGHFDIAALLTANRIDNYSGSMISTADGRLKVSADLTSALVDMYRYVVEEGGSKSLNQLNPGLKTIDAIAKEFAKTEWELTVGKEMIEKTTFRTKRYVIQGDFKNQLARIVLQFC